MTEYVRLLAAGFGLGLSVAAPLGPVGAAAIREGLERGPRGAFLIGLGAASVDFFYLSLVYAGVAPLLVRLPILVRVFYLAGGLLIGQMALGALKRAWRGGMPEPAQRGSTRNAFLFGFGITLLNPTTIVSWLGLGGAFASAYLQRVTLPAALGVLLTVFLGSAAWFTFLAILVGGARQLAGGRPWVFRVVNLVAGLALAGFTLLFLARAALS